MTRSSIKFKAQPWGPRWPHATLIYMDVLESEFLSQQTILWKRYIDDVLCIWTEGKDKLDEFLTRLNSSHPTIKFTHQISDTEVTFLDLTLYKGKRFREEGILDIKPFFKTTNRFQYLHFSSSHPRATKKGNVKGETTRLLRASSDQTTFHRMKNKLHGHFKDRGYPPDLIKSAMEQVHFIKRSELLSDQPKEKVKQPVPFVATYSQQMMTSDLTSALKPPDNIEKPRICYKKNKSVANYLVRAKLRDSNKLPVSNSSITLRHLPTFTSSSTPCGQKLCKCCHQMSKKAAIFDSAGKCYKLPTNTRR